MPVPTLGGPPPPPGPWREPEGSGRPLVGRGLPSGQPFLPLPPKLPRGFQKEHVSVAREGESPIRDSVGETLVAVTESAVSNQSPSGRPRQQQLRSDRDVLLPSCPFPVRLEGAPGASGQVGLLLPHTVTAQTDLWEGAGAPRKADRHHPRPLKESRSKRQPRL